MKILRWRKLFAVQLAACLLLISHMRAAAHDLPQEKVSLSVKDANLKEVLQDISKQTGYRYFFVDQWVAQAKRVTMSVKDVAIEVALDSCFRDQPFTYSLVDRTIVVQQKKRLAEMDTGPTEVRGVVRDESGEPLAGATVSIRKLGKSGITNERGEFVLKNVPNGTYVVDITYVGYNRYTTNITVTDNTVSLAAVLDLSSNKLDEMQVIAYGTTTRRYNVGDVSTVKAVDIQRAPVTNPLLAIEGRVPGLLIQQAVGVPGSAVSVMIQGQNSIQNGNNPFYVIDGVPYDAQLPPGFGSIQGTGGWSPTVTSYGNPLNYINPADIESIDVLKDADATAIYGSRAANGAILITTRKGKAGQTKVDLNFRDGWGTNPRRLKLMNTQQYLQMRHEAIQNDSVTISPTDFDINGTWDTTRYTDWQKKLLGGTAWYMDANAGVSGGNAITQFLVSGAYHRETTVFPSDFSNQKGSMHINVTNHSVNQRFRMELSGSYMVDDVKLPQLDITSQAMYLAPDAPPAYNKDGSLNWAPTADGTSTWDNPVAAFTQRYHKKTHNLVSNLVLSYQIVPGLEIRGSLGYTHLQITELNTSPIIGVRPELRSFTPRSGNYGNSNADTWIVEPQLSYKRPIGSSTLEVLVGTTIQQNNLNGQQVLGIGYNNDDAISDIQSASTLFVTSSQANVYKYNALFGRLNYILSDRYILDLTARRDGSSRFGSANRFHNFGAGGIGWIFTKEKFLRAVMRTLSYGKIRASYGTTGNDQIPDYQFLSLYSPTSVGVPYQGATGLAPNSLANPHLQWEETRKLQFGLDLGFVKDRILLNGSYFINRSSNQLIGYALPVITGFGSVVTNLPAVVKNTGWEITWHSRNIAGHQFDWTTNINLTLPRNRLVSFPNLASSSYADRLVIGWPLTVVKAFHFLGVDPSTGIYQFNDAHGGMTSNPDFTTDRTVLINTSPTAYGGFDNNFRFKGFELDVLFYFVKQKGGNYVFGSLGASTFNTNEPVTLLKRWQKPGDITTIQKYNSNYNLFNQNIAAQNSDAFYTDASYIRLKNVSLSWQMPESWRKSVRLQDFRLFAQAQNLFTITSYKGLDPETVGTLALPPLRVITFGVQVGL